VPHFTRNIGKHCQQESLASQSQLRNKPNHRHLFFVASAASCAIADAAVFGTVAARGTKT